MATLAQPLSAIDTDAILQDRRDAFASVIGTTLAEGVAPEPAAMAIFEKYAAGELSLPEMSAAINALYRV